MRPAVLALVLLSILGCHDSDVRVIPAMVNWMEWPAQVPAKTAFPVRLRGYNASCAYTVGFVPSPKVDQSAVTFEPYCLSNGRPAVCDAIAFVVVDGKRTPVANQFAASYFDTTTMTPGLASDFPRTYEMRASAYVYNVYTATATGLPVRTFGEITVGSSANGRLNAGGFTGATRGTDGCMRLTPAGLFPGYVLENPPDTTSYWSAFVKGYLYAPAAPVCGESTVFHLLSRN